jgi:hypothetical protein
VLSSTMPVSGSVDLVETVTSVIRLNFVISDGLFG